MTMIDSGTVWLKIVEIPMFDLDEVTAGNDEYIDKSTARVSQFFFKHMDMQIPASNQSHV